MIIRLVFFLIFLVSFVTFSMEYYIPHLNFQPPFSEVEPNGEKIISKEWRNSGSTVVGSNFVRLTPDRQSKRGGIWCRTETATDSLSTVLKFRISGQAKNFFGDGIGFWFTSDHFHNEGELHGSHEKFHGVGIIIDTFRNTENFATHRDITLLINDGTRTYEQMTESVIGCNTNVRFHNDRADFSVTDASRIRVNIETNK